MTIILNSLSDKLLLHFICFFWGGVRYIVVSFGTYYLIYSFCLALFLSPSLEKVVIGKPQVCFSLMFLQCTGGSSVPRTIS